MTVVHETAKGRIAAVPDMAEQGDTIELPFDAFYRTEHPIQVRRAYLMTGSRSTAHEVVHDAFVGLLERWDSVERPAAYLNRSVTNACRRHGRRAACAISDAGVLAEVSSLDDESRLTIDPTSIELVAGEATTTEDADVRVRVTDGITRVRATWGEDGAGGEAEIVCNDNFIDTRSPSDDADDDD